MGLVVDVFMYSSLIGEFCNEMLMNNVTPNVVTYSMFFVRKKGDKKFIECSMI